MEYSQVELVRGIKNRDTSAYEYMISKYGRITYCLAYQILSGTHSKEDIEECVADVFLDAWVKIGAYDEEKASFRTWLLILTKYKALTYRRKKALDAFGKPQELQATKNFENLGKDGMVTAGGPAPPEPIYATDQAGTKYQLTKPDNAKAWPITTFDIDASKDSKLTVKLPGLMATYKKVADRFTVNIPKDGEKVLSQEVDLFAQKAVVKNIKRLSPTSAELTFALNTGADKNVKITCFHLDGPDIKKYSANFDGDTAVVTIEFFKEADAYDIDISWPSFVMNGNWTINLK
ncbi:MAG: hypothetical protein GXY34_09315 [Syntrophomonadaceae bacterium]|nr:hypothetical protein [Syntrophomonadaceae bacterium]